MGVVGVLRQPNELTYHVPHNPIITIRKNYTERSLQLTQIFKTHIRSKNREEYGFLKRLDVQTK